MVRPLSILFALSCLAAIATSARAEFPGERGEMGDPVTTTELGGFQSPSKNIACKAYTDVYQNGSETILRCNVAETTNRLPAKPRECDLKWGNDFEMTGTAGPEFDCYLETVADPALPVLAYGEVWQQGGFTCRSEQAGVTCFNPLQHGFRLSRAQQEMF